MSPSMGLGSLSLRLLHVLDKLGNPREMNRIPDITKAMVEDVEREGKGEILESKEARKAISARTVQMFKKLLTERMVEGDNGEEVNPPAEA